MPVGLPTAHDIAPLSSPSDSLHYDDLEAGHGHGVELSSSTLTKEIDTENIGLVTSTRRTGKSKSPIRQETSDSTDSALPLPPTSPSDDLTPKSTSFPALNPRKSPSTTALPIAGHVSLSSTSNSVPDLLMESTPAAVMSSAPPLEPSLSSSARTMHTENLEIPTPSSSKKDVEEAPSMDTKIHTVRLIGGGGESGIAQSPIEIVAPSVNDQPEPSPPVAMTTVPALTLETELPKKVHKKSKSGLANLKRFSVGALIRKKDSVSSMKDSVPPSR